MRSYCPLAGIGLLGLLAAGVILAQSRAGTQPTGDVFSSSGAPDDRRKYLSPDGRSFDRCGYETAHMADLPDTRLYGMPDHVPIDRDIMSQYVRCAVDSCAVNQKAVCWGKTSRQNPVMPTSPDSFNSNGFTNCQADGMAVVCDPPKLLPILPAVCLAGTTVICETKVSFKLYAKVDTAKMIGYYDNYGKTLPAMSGQTYFQRTTIYVKTPAGFGVGQGLAGPVKVQSSPARFSSAAGYIDPSTTNIFVMTELRDLSGNQVLADQQTIRVFLK
jgi:hypothetical protein